VPLDPMAGAPGWAGERPRPTGSPDTRGLDERFPDPVPPPSPAAAARLSSADAPLEADTYGRSLVYSGVLGLAIALTGLAMMVRRRRTW
jgi:hypothetical protein